MICEWTYYYYILLKDYFESPVKYTSRFHQDLSWFLPSKPAADQGLSASTEPPSNYLETKQKTTFTLPACFVLWELRPFGSNKLSNTLYLPQNRSAPVTFHDTYPQSILTFSPYSKPYFCDNSHQLN